MDEHEARSIASTTLSSYRTRTFDQLAALVNTTARLQVNTNSGIAYQVEIQFFWDDRPNGPIRVLAAVDDGGMRAFVPISEDFIIAPDGTFVCE